MPWATSLHGTDGQPVIQIETAVRDGPLLTLSGNASVYEGTVLIDLLKDDEVVDQLFGTASEGSPGRGSWQITFELRECVTSLRVREEDMEETPPEVRLRATISIPVRDL